MPAERSLRDVLRNMLQYGDLSFRDFVELALYHPEFGYYGRAASPIGKEADYVTAPHLSPAFSFSIARLIHEFVRRNEGAVSSFVDIGCGDGQLLRELSASGASGASGSSEGESLSGARNVLFFGIDRSLDRVRTTDNGQRTTFLTSINDLPRTGAHLIFSNELFDAFPFARLVARGEHIHELWVTEREGELDWTEHEAAPVYDDYFAARGIGLEDGQFADVSLEWEAYYEDLARTIERGLIVTIDYGYPEKKLFHSRVRRFGTAASYSRQRVTRDLLANPGEQDLTAHINFTDLERAGERHGFRTLFFDRLATFLLAIGITEHELFRPVHEVGIDGMEEGLALIGAREAARRLVLPDGIGEDLRVLVQGRGVPLEGWSFQKPLIS
jgi:SAM-dependent MidA family methyltransferase